MREIGGSFSTGNNDDETKHVERKYNKIAK